MFQTSRAVPDSPSGLERDAPLLVYIILFQMFQMFQIKGEKRGKVYGV